MTEYMRQDKKQVREAIAANAEEKANPPKKSSIDRFLESLLSAMEKGERKVRQALRKIFGVSSRPKGPTNTPPPNSPGPEFRGPSLPDWYWNGIRAVTRALPKALLAAAVLTGFAEKKTQEPTAGDKEPPKAVLNVGTLGVTVAKVKMNNGSKTTDFDANMPLAKAAKEAVGKVLPQSEQDKLFEDKPIENGAFESISETLSFGGVARKLSGKAPKSDKKDNATLLKEGSDSQTKNEQKDEGYPWGGVAAAAGLAVAAGAASKKGQKPKGEYTGPVRDPREGRS